MSFYNQGSGNKPYKNNDTRKHPKRELLCNHLFLFNKILPVFDYKNDLQKSNIYNLFI